MADLFPVCVFFFLFFFKLQSEENISLRSAKFCVHAKEKKKKKKRERVPLKFHTITTEKSFHSKRSSGKSRTFAFLSIITFSVLHFFCFVF